MSNLDVICGHYDFLKTAMKQKHDPHYVLAEQPQEFRLISGAAGLHKGL